MQNTAINGAVGLVFQSLSLILGFFSRKILIDYLGIDYLGVNGLFTNILTIFSFAELGIGHAIIYNLYKPLATEDKDKIQRLIKFYAYAYKIIALVILICGLMVLPFLQYIIKEPPQITEDIKLIYLLFLLNTVLSYLFIYKKSLIRANQKEYIVVFWENIFHIALIAIQILLLILVRNYILHISLSIIFTLISNIYISYKANKLYPYIKEKNDNVLDKKEKKLIFKNVKALFLYKIGSISLNATDNIIISALIGITVVGLASNYILIITSISLIVNHIINAFTAPVGNLNATADKVKQEKVFNQMFLFTSWLIGFIAIGILLLSNDFIGLFFGQEYTLDFLVVFSLVLHYYIKSVQNTAYTYRTTMGLYIKGKWAPVIASIINIVLSIVLGNLIGLAGIYFATSISRLLTMVWVDPYLIYKYKFNKSPIQYFIKYLLYFVVVVLNFLLNYYIITIIKIDGIFGFIIKIVICSFLTNIVMFLTYFKTNTFKDIMQSIKILYKNMLKNKSKAG